MVSCCWINKLVERAKNPRHWALRCGWTFNPSTSLVGGSIEEMKRRYEMECDKEFRSHVLRGTSPSEEPDNDAELRSDDEGTANQQRTHEGRVKQRTFQKDVPKQSEKVESNFSPTVARLRILRGFPPRVYRQIEHEADHKN
jgi:hypothetical protein